MGDQMVKWGELDPEISMDAMNALYWAFKEELKANIVTKYWATKKGKPTEIVRTYLNSQIHDKHYRTTIYHGEQQLLGDDEHLKKVNEMIEIVKKFTNMFMKRFKLN